MSEDSPPLDRTALLSSLNRHGVRFVLVGGLAAQAHGATRATKDADVCPEWGDANLARLAASLNELKARLKIGEGSVDLLEVAIDAHTIHNIEIGTWRTAAGDIDVLLGIPRESRSVLARYEQLVENAVEFEVDHLRILVASLDDIIRSKEVAGRVKDRQAVHELRALRASSGGAGEPGTAGP